MDVAGGEIHPVGGECQRLGQPAAGIGQRHAQGPYRAIGDIGLPQEGVAFAAGEVFARAGRGVRRRLYRRRPELAAWLPVDPVAAAGAAWVLAA